MEYPGRTRLLKELSEIVRQRKLVRLVLGSPRPGSSAARKVTLTPVKLRRGYRLKVVYRYPDRDITHNHTEEEAIALVSGLLEREFKNADLFATDRLLQYGITSAGKEKFSEKFTDGIAAPTLGHDRKKSRLIETEGNIYLKELGLLNAAFEIRREMSDKFIQINRYVEILEPHFRTVDRTKPFYITDMGSGKGYLTFALYDYLLRNGFQPWVTGVEQRQELVDQSNRIAKEAGFEHLHFVKGSIRETFLERVDMLIALHACDTATDDAIYRGITAKAGIIVVAPCCHKQLRKSIVPPEQFYPVFRHGLLGERQAELLTDAIRAMVLEAFGYRPGVIEFVASDHTPKNLMIIARKVRKQEPGRAFPAIWRFLELFGVQRHYLTDFFIKEQKSTG